MKLKELHSLIPIYPSDKLIELLINIKTNKNYKVLTEFEIKAITTQILEVLSLRFNEKIKQR